jgi:hypothetical protein
LRISTHHPHANLPCSAPAIIRDFPKQISIPP